MEQLLRIIAGLVEDGHPEEAIAFTDYCVRSIEETNADRGRIEP